MQYQLLNVVKIADVCKVYSVVNTFGLAGILYLKYSQYIVSDMCCLLILPWPIHISEINSISSHIIIISYLLTLQLQLQKSPEIFKYPAGLPELHCFTPYHVMKKWVWCMMGRRCPSAEPRTTAVLQIKIMEGGQTMGSWGHRWAQHWIVRTVCIIGLRRAFYPRLWLGWVVSTRKADFERMIFFWEMWKLSLSPLCLFWDKLWDCLPECLS